MNFVLFVTVASLVFHQGLSCKVTTVLLSILDVTGPIFGSYLGHNEWNLDVAYNMAKLSLTVFYKEDNEWEKLKIKDFCDNNKEFIILQQILCDSIGLDTCIMYQGNYSTNSVLEYPDDVCDEVSEITRGNEDRLYFELFISSISSISMQMKIEH